MFGSILAVSYYHLKVPTRELVVDLGGGGACIKKSNVVVDGGDGT